MSNIEVSPGKENQHKVEIVKELGNDKLQMDTVLVENPQTKEHLSHNLKVLELQLSTLDLKGIDYSKMFDTLGPARLFVGGLKQSISLAYFLLKTNDEEVAQGKKQVMDDLAFASSVSNAAEKLLFICADIFKKIDKGPLVKACFEELSTPLANFIEYIPNLKRLKFSIVKFVDTVILVLDKMKTLSFAPYDSALLSTAERLLIACFNNTSHPKLSTAAAAMWNTTFGNSKDLVYSDSMRDVLLMVRKKKTIFIPNLSVYLIGKDDQSKKPTKRVLALGNEDSVDYVPIAQMDSTKKMKLTEHQKEVFSTVREKMPFMDEDSIQLKTTVLSQIEEQYDVDSTISGSQSTKNMTSPPNTSSIENNVAKKEETKREETSTELTKESTPIQTNKPSTSDSEKLKSTRITRSARRALDLPSPSDKEEKKESPKSVEVPLSLEQETKKENSEKPEPSKSSRRSLTKGTPTKYENKRRGRPRKSKVETESPKKNEAAQPEENKNDFSDEDSVTLDKLVINEKNKKNESKKKESESEVEKKDEKEQENNTVTSDTPMEVDQPTTQEVLCTPSKSVDITLDSQLGIRSTPGILKKAATPSTADRKALRVHFPVTEEEKIRIETTPRRGKLDSYLKMGSPIVPQSPTPKGEPMYPSLSGDTTPINKIIDKLVPVNTQSAATMLKKQLGMRNIHTVGDLAGTLDVVIGGLPIKVSVAKIVLAEYESNKKKGEAEEIKKRKEEDPSVELSRLGNLTNEELELEFSPTHRTPRQDLDDRKGHKEPRIDLSPIKHNNFYQEPTKKSIESTKTASMANSDALEALKTLTFNTLEKDARNLLSTLSNIDADTIDISSDRVIPLVLLYNEITIRIGELQKKLLGNMK